MNQNNRLEGASQLSRRRVLIIVYLVLVILTGTKWGRRGRVEYKAVRKPGWITAYTGTSIAIMRASQQPSMNVHLDEMITPAVTSTITDTILILHRPLSRAFAL